ncbi:MAG TPA: SDR family NAD(P)-dependent oxidoreductase, partial [Albitalea sp.]|nr:SDR family NAD(P)-dependent oxidoreductase [Albitalea sp.]
YVAAALRRLGFDATPGRRFAPVAEAASLRIAARHARLFARLLQMLAEDGVLRAHDGGFELTGALPTADPAAHADALARRFGAIDGELSTLRRCGPELARVLSGEQDPLQLLFPGGSFAEARKLYVESPFARSYNAALAEALQCAIAQLPPGTRLRVLEIGAGTGGTTGYVLARLPAERVEYTFTDLSPLFLERAAEQFKEVAGLRGALLDIERDPLAQGFQAGHYDVVIAANVLHATADLAQSLRHARTLMAGDGLLLLLEGVAPERWVDLTFGLTEGWWRFVDSGLRPRYPLIARDTWHTLLGEVGFGDVATVPDDAGGRRGLIQQALIVARAPVVPRRWALVGGPSGLASALAQRLAQRGDQVVTLASDSDALPAVDEWVYLAALALADDADEPAKGEALACATPLRWLARLAHDEHAGRAWLVTQGAQSTRPAARWQLPLWGVGRVFSLEHPSRFGGLIDLDAAVSGDALADQLLAALAADDGEDQTVWRAGARLACRLTRAPAPATPEIALRADASYLVTGGFGGLGLLVAKWLAERGARHIALLGRHLPSDAADVQAIEALGAQVIALAADVADEDAMRGALARLAKQAPPLRGIVHAAAALSAAPITELSAEQVHAMLRPKISGTLVLQRLTRDAGLDFLALFSSTTALLGASGFAHYAAANLFLDATAQAADQSAQRVLSVNWGTWEAMRLASAQSQRSYREGGLEPMAAADGLAALGRLLSGSAPQAVVAKIDWSVLKPLHEARRARPFLAQLDAAPAAPRHVEAAAAAEPGLFDRIAAAPQAMRQEMLIEFVSHEVAAVLGLDASQPVPVDKGLFDLGMDSLMSVELKRRLERGAGQTLPSTLTFNYPNVGALAAFLETRLAATAAAAVPVQPATPAASVAPTPPASSELDALSDEELEARLLASLEQAR